MTPLEGSQLPVDRVQTIVFNPFDLHLEFEPSNPNPTHHDKEDSWADLPN